MDNYILIGMFIMNGKFNDNNYLYFEIFDNKSTIPNNKYSSDMLWLKNTIKELYNCEPFKCVKSKKLMTQVYYNSKELKSYLIDLLGGHNYRSNRSFNKLNNFSKDELFNVIIGLKTSTSNYINFKNFNEINELYEIFKNKDISVDIKTINYYRYLDFLI
jgi:hypothetical protein